MREAFVTKKDLDQVSLYHFPHEGKLLAAINNLIELFNYNRENLSDSYLTKESVSAYLYYFFSTNVPKIPGVLSRLDQSLLNELAKCDVIDFGSGPGTLMLGWEQFFSGESKYFLYEQSKIMSQACDNVIEHWDLDQRAEIVSKISSKLGSNEKVLCFSNSYNEISDDKFFQVLGDANPRFIFLLEPGTKEVFSRIHQLRAKLIKNGYQVHYPCSSSGECPIDPESDWCHQYLKLSHDPEIERITQKLKRDRRNVPIIFHLYEKTEITPKIDSGVIFRRPQERKFGFEFSLCRFGNENEIVPVKVLKKRDGYNKKAMKSLMQGDRVQFEVLKENGDGALEIKLA